MTHIIYHSCMDNLFNKIIWDNDDENANLAKYANISVKFVEF